MRDTPAQFVTDSALFHRGLMIDQEEQAFCLQLEDSELAHALGSAPGIRSKGLDELHRIVVQLHPHPFNIIRRDFEIKQAVPKAFATAYMWVLYVVNSLGKLKIDVCVCVRARAQFRLLQDCWRAAGASVPHSQPLHTDKRDIVVSSTRLSGTLQGLTFGRKTTHPKH